MPSIPIVIRPHHFLALALLTARAGAEGEAPDVAAQVHHANEMLAAYHGDNPVKSERKLWFVYFVPSDRVPAPDYRRRLTRVMEETAGFFQRELERVGFTPKPMPLDRRTDGGLRFILVPGREPWTAYNTKEWASAKKVQDECRPFLAAAGIDPELETIALFSTIMEWDEAARRFRQKAPYRGGGGARQGFCWQIDAPPLDPRHLGDKTPQVDDGEYGMISQGEWNSKFIGGVIHELGHALGLPHNQERPAERKTIGTSLMGTGNWTYGRERRGEGLGTFLTTADALRLASHPFFTGSSKGLGPAEKSTGRVKNLSVEADGDAIVVRGEVESAPATYALIAYVDPAGRDDYDALTATTIPGRDGKFWMRWPGLPRGRACGLRIAGLQVNGLTYGSGELHFEVTKEGVVQLDDLRATLVLEPIVSALREGRAGLASKLAFELPESEPARALAAPMLLPPGQRAERPDAAVKEVSLCDLRPEKALVGWRTPAYDYSPMDLFVRLDGKLQRHCIYAHAPSSYAWRIDGTWTRFQATCAIGNGYEGSVVFVVRADGAERWRSKLLKGGVRENCDVDISRARTLELSVEDGGDDNHYDHAFWFAPLLKRP